MPYDNINITLDENQNITDINLIEVSEYNVSFSLDDYIVTLTEDNLENFTLTEDNLENFTLIEI